MTGPPPAQPEQGGPIRPRDVGFRRRPIAQPTIGRGTIALAFVAGGLWTSGGASLWVGGNAAKIAMDAVYMCIGGALFWWSLSRAR